MEAVKATPASPTGPRSGQKKVRYKRRIKAEPPDIKPKIEPCSDAEESMVISPIKNLDPVSDLETTQNIIPADPQPIKKKAKVMLPSLDAPRGVRTLLPGNYFKK